MTPRFVRLGLVVFSSVIALQALAQPPPTVPPPSGAPVAPPVDDPMVTLKLPDADIDTILTALEIYTGRSQIRPAQLPTATFNLKIAEPIPKSQAILAIETVLALNNIGVTPLGDRFFVVTQLPQTARTAPPMITGSAFDLPPSGKIATKVFQLDFLRVTEIQPLIQNILNPNVAAPIIALQNANAMMVTDSVANLQRVEMLLEKLDKPISAGMKPKFYQLTEAKASDLATKLRTILQGTLQTQLGTATTYNADDRTNQIIVVTDPRQYPLFDELIAKLDVRADPNTRNDVIYLKHAEADILVNVLNTVIRGQTQATQQRNTGSVRPGQLPGQPNIPTPGAPGAPVAPVITPQVAAAVEGFGSGSNEFSALMTVASDKRSNAVVVSGTADDIRLINQLIDKLDIVLAQVRIEVVIAEVTLEDNHQSGISTLGLQVDGDRLIGFNMSAEGIGVGGSGDGSFASISRIGGPGSLARSLDLTGIIQLGTTPRKRNATILTVPAVVTSHGKQAIINDGETRPVITGSTSIPGAAQGVTTQSQIQQQPIGTTITVTPFIGNDGSVQLDLQQELSDVTGTVTVDGNTQYIIGTRKTQSYITAKSGEILVLGGFRKRSDLKETNRLGPLAFIGDLFGKRQKNYYHKELIFFLRPRVLTNNPEIDNAETMRKLEQLPTRNEIKQQLDPNFQPPSRSPIDRVLGK